MASPYRQVQWLISEYDFRVHAFHHVDDAKGFLEALCTHTVPPEKILRQEQTALSPSRCEVCLLRHGEDIASHVQRWMD